MIIILFFLSSATSSTSILLEETRFCGDCSEVTISSSGGALQHLPEKMGAYALAGSLWENMMPFWKSTSDQYITPDANSNPILYYIKWVVSDAVGSPQFSASMLMIIDDGACHNVQNKPKIPKV